MDFGGGSEGGTGGGAGVALLHGQGGGEALDGIDGGRRKGLEVQAGVGGKGLKVAALSFRINGVEGEGGFAGTGGAREDNEPVAWDIEINPGQIVLAGTAEAEEIAGSAHRRAVGAPMPGLGRRGGRGVDVDPAVASVKADLTVRKGKESVVTPHADVLTGVEFGAPLTHEDGASGNDLAAKTLHAETLTAAVAPVSCRSLTFFMCHGGILRYLPPWIVLILIRVRA